MALEKANGGIAARPEYPRAGHLGYYLVGKGVKQLVKDASAKFTFGERLVTFLNKVPLLLYTGISFFLAAVMTGTLVLRSWQEGFTKPWILGTIAFVCMIGCSQLSIALVNWVSTLIIRPMILPRMDFEAGIPDDFKTLVVIPSMFNELKELEELVENLEVRFLANRGRNIHFALLTDFKDAKTEHLPDESELLRLARVYIEELNNKYAGNQNDIFFLFHRPRKYNHKEKVWLGFERKRGKLAEMNALLRGTGEEKFSLIVGDSAVYQRVKYVITLDTDTQLPRDAAWKNNRDYGASNESSFLSRTETASNGRVWYSAASSSR